jgi:hypothetical protein
MKNKYLTLAMLTAVLYAHGQQTPEGSSTRHPDSLYQKRKVSRTEIKVLFSYYTQDGDHSAITGGTGTEWLHVYSPEFTITHKPDSTHALQLNGGIDIITSASMDKIDFDVRTGASRVSARNYLNPSYSYLFRKIRTRVGINSGFSIESAYLSFPAGLSVSHTNASGTREISASLNCFFDDLRFGRISRTYKGPLELVYPVELRDTSWFPIYRRYSYNLDFALYQTINTKIQFALFPGLVYQKGLLSTPYHRVYFNDSTTERVENLPRERWKFPIGAQLNIFAGRNVIIRSYYRYYHDNFGINSHTLQFEVPVKINPALTLSPMVRLYIQTASHYFRPYKQHDTTEKYYTSDYDLSGFKSFKTGLTIRYAPQAPIGHRYFFDALSLRYSYYHRSDGLHAHILSLLLELEHVRGITPRPGP